MRRRRGGGPNRRDGGGDDAEEGREAEERSALVLGTIREAIDHVRAYHQISPSSTSSQHATASRQPPPPLFPPEFCDRVGEVTASAGRPPPSLAVQLVAAGNCGGGDDVGEGEGEDGENDDDDERRRAVVRVLLPLLESLGSCYRILDRLVDDDEAARRRHRRREHQQGGTQDRAQQDDAASHLGGRPNRKQRNSREPPPIGMLSLRNYADVAAACEFLVCTSVVPLILTLEVEQPEAAAAAGDIIGSTAKTTSSVLAAAVERRARALPNSVAGRLPRRCLAWGCRNSIGSSGKDNGEDPRRRHPAEELAAAARVLGDLLLLDRFRPMLLPRHLPDLYAAVFASRHLRQKRRISPRVDDNENDGGEALLESLESRILGSAWGGGSGDGEEEEHTPVVVDGETQARALRSLLGQGLSSPEWLRRSASGHLNRLAVTDLPALVSAFVEDGGGGGGDPAASGSAGSSALRLARTLTLPPSKTAPNQSQQQRGNAEGGDASYYGALGEQVIRLLDGIASASASASLKMGNGRDSSPAAETLSFTRQQVVHVHAAWALLGSLPQSSWERHMVLRGSGAEECAEEDAATAALLRRWSLLLSHAPPFACTAKLCLLALRAPKQVGKGSQKQPLSFVARLLRLATGTDNSHQSRVLHSKLRQEALTTLRWLSQAVLQTEFRFNRKRQEPSAPSSASKEENGVARFPGYEILAVALLYALAPGCNGGFESEDPTSLAATVQGMEDRAQVLVNDVLMYLLQERTGNGADKKAADSSFGKDHRDRERSLVATIFLFLLEVYFDASEGDAGIRLVPMVALPRLCEECPPDALLHSSGDARNRGGATGLFGMMKVVFETMASRLSGDSLVDAAESTMHAAVQTSSTNRCRTIAGRLGFRSFSSTASPAALPSSTIADEEMLVSVGSLLLSLLIGVLELGSERRTSEEEALLQSFVDALRPLASVSSDECGKQVPSELAQMASHAIALLVARRASLYNSEAPVSDCGDAERSFPDKLAEVEHDLRSAEAPMRARAVVTLRHLASALGDVQVEGGNAARNLSIMLGENLKGLSEDNVSLWRMLRISVQALADSESYVYLAAIQTIATIADVRPREIIGSVAMAVSCGELRCGDQVDVALTPEQRAKLAEALIAVVRRKATIRDYLPFLLDAMVFGTDRIAEEPRSLEDSKLMAEKTHKYFLGLNSNSDESEEITSEDAKWEEIKTRVRTGGPLFESEETDVVRAAKLNVVSELVSVTDPAVVARHCSVLVLCSIDCIRLDASRPVRRAGALLARSLYEALVQEQDQLALTQNEEDRCIRLAVAMADAEEEVLAASLERCVKAADLNDLGPEKCRVHDPAAAARCQEALALRAEAEGGGILAIGKLVHESESRAERSPILRTLLEPTEGKKAENAREVTSPFAKRMIEEL